MRARERHQIGAPRRHDGVHLIGGRDRADAHRGDAGLVADLVGERRLEHAAVDRLGIGRGLSGRHVDQVAAGLREGARDLRPHRRR